MGVCRARKCTGEYKTACVTGITVDGPFFVTMCEGELGGGRDVAGPFDDIEAAIAYFNLVGL